MATAQKVPLGAPTATSQPTPAPALTADQQKKYDWVLEQIKGLKEVPSTKGKAGPLTDNEKFWLTKECILRFLRATKWNQKDSEKRIIETLTWRREYGVEELTAEHISPENETGKQIIVGYDNDGRPCHYLNPGRQNTDPSPRQVQHLVYMLERVIDIMPPQQEKLALLINFKQSKSRSNTAPGIGLAREVLHILQTHYPERLGKALIINVPWVVWGFFKLITPFIDPITREKLKFNEDMNQYVPSEQLWTEFNGKLEFDYDHSVYWPALTKLCSERQEEKKQRWIAAGKHIGEYEEYLTGHVETGVAGPVAAKVEEKAVEPKAASTEAQVLETIAEAEVPPKAAKEVVAAETKAEEAPETAVADEALAKKAEELAISEEKPAVVENGEAKPAVAVAAA